MMDWLDWKYLKYNKCTPVEILVHSSQLGEVPNVYDICRQMRIQIKFDDDLPYNNNLPIITYDKAGNVTICIENNISQAKKKLKIAYGIFSIIHGERKEFDIYLYKRSLELLMPEWSINLLSSWGEYSFPIAQWCGTFGLAETEVLNRFNYLNDKLGYTCFNFSSMNTRVKKKNVTIKYFVIVFSFIIFFSILLILKG